MQRISLETKPQKMTAYRKKSTVELLFVDEPFVIETQEGPMTISPETVDDWDGGYFVAFPDDGSKPYSIAPAYVRNNYVPV